MTAIAIWALASLTGFLGAMVGIGGGAFLVPALVLALDIKPVEAMPISLICALATAVSATLQPISGKVVRRAFLFEPLAILGVIIFTPLALVLKSQQILLFFSIFIFSVIFISAMNKPSNHSVDMGLNKETFLGLITAFLSGACAGLFGVGGGIIMVPLLSLLSRIPTKEAVQISLLVMISTSVLALLIHSLTTQVSWYLGIAAAAGALPAAFLGGIVRLRLSDQAIKRVFTGCSLIIATATLARSLGARV